MIIIIITIIFIIYALNTMKRHPIIMGVALNEIFDSRAAQASYDKGKLVCGVTIGGVCCREGR